MIFQNSTFLYSWFINRASVTEIERSHAKRQEASEIVHNNEKVFFAERI